jgi:hypothetical protein
MVPFGVKNARLLVKFSRGEIHFATGRFDDWAVHVSVADWPQYPKDEWYFKKLKKFALFLGDVVYDDFVSIFEATTAEIDENVLKNIKAIAKKYPTPWEAEGIFYILYGGMIAEENKENAILKKRMKMLGVHQLLKEGFTSVEAAGFSWGKPWYELDEECQKYGF